MEAMPTRPRPAHRLLIAGLAALALAVASACSGEPATPADAASHDTPVVSPLAARAGTVAWSEPLQLTAEHGDFVKVVVTDPRGYDIDGALVDGLWRSASDLLPGSAYHVSALVKDQAGTQHHLGLTVRTSRASKTLSAVLSPRSNRVVGVGLPAIVTLSRPVTSAADRRAVVARLSVETAPPVAGAWRWMSNKELHYRGPAYWAKGTVISVHSDLDGLRLSRGVWGSGVVNTRFRVGSAVISTVDVTKHVMTVTVDGVLVRTIKVSTGREKFPTKGGVHLVLEKSKLKIMDSATVGIPRDAPDGYYEKIPNSVRISYSGEFVHSASWSVRDQGVRNVSHGCVNVSPADAAWFFDLVKRGDVVDVINASVKPLLHDPGTSDWNIPFETWANS